MEEHSDYAVSLLLKDYYQKVDGPNQGQTYLSPQSGWTPPRVKTTVHIMDGPNQGKKLIQVHKVDGPHQGSRQQST